MGRGNAKLIAFSSDREARVTLQDAIFDNLAIAMLTGNTVEEGVKTLDLYFEGKIDEAGEIEVPHTIKGITTVYVLAEDGVTNQDKIAEPTFSGKTVDVGTEHEGETVRVYYTAETDASAKTIKVTSDMFGGTFKLVVDVMVRDEHTQNDYFAQFVANRAKVEDEFSFNFAPDGDPSVLDIPMEILRHGRSDMWELIIYDNEAMN